MSFSKITHNLSEANSDHGIHGVSEGFPIIYFPQTERFATSQVVEGCPPSLQPEAGHTASTLAFLMFRAGSGVEQHRL